MPKYDRSASEKRLAAVPFGTQARRLIDYWLSLWDGDELPLRSRFRPSAVKSLLPGLLILEVGEQPEIICRLAGTAITESLGVDITGKDLLFFTPENARSTRRERYRRVAAGAVGRILTDLVSRQGQSTAVEGVMLPFLAGEPGASRQVVMHSSWRPPGPDRHANETRNAIELPLEFQLIPLTTEDQATLAAGKILKKFSA